MDNKCSKYEGLFIFSNNETLQKHIEECPDCQAEHEKMQKVSNLIGETKFYYMSKFKKRRKLKAICAIIMFMFCTTTFSFIDNDGDFCDALLYGDSLTAEDLGFPVDSYGLLMVDDEI
ncbi:hypothetical protein J6R97_04285 [bacterium]|nr:hypothetical protein [bacterium]